MEESRRRPYFGNGMGNRKFANRRKNKDDRSYNIGGKRDEYKGSKGDVWKKKEEKEERNNRQENKDQVNGKKSQNENVVKTGNKYDALNVLKEDNKELEILKGRMIVDTFLELKRLREEEEMNEDIKDVIDVNSGIAKELNTEEVRGVWIKPSKLSKAAEKAFGGWDWVSNSSHSINSCRILVGWDKNKINLVVLMGDFNVTLKIKEHSARGSRSTGDMHDFVECVNDIEVEEVNQSGFIFTWIKSPSKPKTSIIKKLDRVLINSDFLGSFGGFGKKDEEFERSLEKASLEEWELILASVNDEEKLLAQKAEVKWLNEGDKNTRYFHNVVKSRMNMNRIIRISDKQGNWFEGDKIPDQFIKHFKKYLSNESENDQIDAEGLFNKKLTAKEANFMELLKGYNRKSGPPRCALKIDIAKAYDTLNWRFLEQILKQFGFLEKLIGWVITCVSNAAFSTSVNGERYGYFKSGRGLRQGDLMSPLLIHPDYGSPNSYGAKKKVLKEGLMEFSKTSGLVPNMNKSTIFFGSVKGIERKRILEVMPFNVGILPMKYIGVPLITKNIGISECNQLVERVKQKVNDWKNKALSYVGRLQLIASVLVSMHIYWASVFLIPKTTVKEIEKSLKGFLWCQGELKRGATWKVICGPKSQGDKKDSLWVKWANVVKLKGKSIWEIEIEDNDSGTWKAILNLMSKIRDSVWKKMGDGKSTNIWFDKWCDEGPLCDKIPFRCRYQARLDEKTSVADMIVNNEWVWPKDSKTQFSFLTSIMVPDLKEGSLDCAIWKDNNGTFGKFSIRKVWEIFKEVKDDVNWYKEAITMVETLYLGVDLGKMPLILIAVSDGLGRVWLPIWVNLGFCIGNVAKLEEPFMDYEWGYNLHNNALSSPVYAIVNKGIAALAYSFSTSVWVLAEYTLILFEECCLQC
ncbi:RNA-directed DNA polymerase, eukaryota, reverse transcriptase zinc-binding domain protein [Tanacetum coccineum]